jgi:hypothetical protein
MLKPPHQVLLLALLITLQLLPLKPRLMTAAA